MYIHEEMTTHVHVLLLGNWVIHVRSDNVTMTCKANLIQYLIK